MFVFFCNYIIFSPVLGTTLRDRNGKQKSGSICLHIQLTPVHNQSQTPASSSGFTCPVGWSTPTTKGSKTASLLSPRLEGASTEMAVSCGLGYTPTSRRVPRSRTSSSTVPHTRSSLLSRDLPVHPSLLSAWHQELDQTPIKPGEQITHISWIFSVIRDSSAVISQQMEKLDLFTRCKLYHLPTYQAAKKIHFKLIQERHYCTGYQKKGLFRRFGFFILQINHVSFFLFDFTKPPIVYIFHQ